MPINRAQARKLSSEKEFDLVDDSYYDRLNELTLVQARSKAKRARKLLEKWQALAPKQSRGTKTTNAAALRGEESPQRTKQKIELFQQATDRFEERVAALEAQRKRPKSREVAPTASKKMNPIAKLFSAREANKAKRMLEQHKKAKGPLTKALEGRIRERAIFGHQSTATRQEQGRRDSRPDSH